MAVEGNGSQRRAVPFHMLDADIRLAVELAAKRGELHPDHMVAASSVAWAESGTSRPKGLQAMAVLAIGAAVHVLAFGDAPDGDGLVDVWRGRRLRKRIVRAARRIGYEAPSWALLPDSRESQIPVAELLNRSGVGVELSEGPRQRRHGQRPGWRW